MADKSFARTWEGRMTCPLPHRVPASRKENEPAKPVNRHSQKLKNTVSQFRARSSYGTLQCREEPTRPWEDAGASFEKLVISAVIPGGHADFASTRILERSILRRLSSSQLTTCLPPDTAVTLWFLALSLGWTGAAPPVQSRIVGSWDCEKHSQPWQAALYHYSSFQCGGVLVHPQWVLTAAHCISDFYQLWLGRQNLFDWEDTTQLFSDLTSFPHPKFSLSLLEDDPFSRERTAETLTRLRPGRPAEVAAAVKGLRLPTQEPQLGSTCCASGWS
ncbi:kallikrein-1-like [Pteropus alecto]|uniref:kallikrein-1-like n=1 Tax=Pteropus alecto TaxID=9402 RepID=UPI00076897A9|nr:kallikrein-1-like [Pteropus alecto]